jgi:diguanylate cyclase (GGDEF)-like protein
MSLNRSNIKVSARAEEIQVQMQALANRDVQLWSITLLIVIVLASGFAAIVAPNISWNTDNVRVESRYVPQIFFGLISLILLFNLYVFSQKRTLAATRKALLQELVFNGKVDRLGLVDPATGLFSRRALDQMLGKEVVRANRLGNSLSLLMVDLDGKGNFGKGLLSRDARTLVEEVAQLMASTFRGSDIVFRYADTEFVVVMPDTTEQQAERALKRFEEHVSLWKQENRSAPDSEMIFGLGTYITGASVSDLLESVHRRMFLKKHKLVPVF